MKAGDQAGGFPHSPCRFMWFFAQRTFRYLPSEGARRFVDNVLLRRVWTQLYEKSCSVLKCDFIRGYFVMAKEPDNFFAENNLQHRL